MEIYTFNDKIDGRLGEKVSATKRNYITEFIMQNRKNSILARLCHI